MEKALHFFNVNLVEDIPTQVYSKISEAAVRKCTTTQSFLKNSQKLQECTCTRVSFQPRICNFIEKMTPTYIAFCEFCEIFQEHLYYEQTLQEKICIREPFKEVDTEFNSSSQLHHRYFFSKLCYSNILYLLLFSGKNLEVL